MRGGMRIVRTVIMERPSWGSHHGGSFLRAIILEQLSSLSFSALAYDWHIGMRVGGVVIGYFKESIYMHRS